MADWSAIKTEYITTQTSYRKLAEKYGLQTATIARRAAKEKWVEQRHQNDIKTSSKIIAASSKKKVDRATRLRDAADRLLDKVERAIDELDLQMVTHKDKVKTIEYNNPERADKPTKEIIHETEQILSVSSIIDRKGLQQIAAALKDIKELHGIKSDLDRQEQEAKIAQLRRQANLNDDEDDGTGVIILPPVKEDTQ